MDKPVHVRRCHVCGGVNEVEEGKVEKCSHCHRSLAPFYYFDDRLSLVASDSEVRQELPPQEYIPIQGLTVYWETF